MAKAPQDPQVMNGPFTLEMSFPFVAYVFKAPQLPAVCMTAHLDEHHVLLNQTGSLLENSLTEIRKRYKKWREIPCIHTHVLSGGQNMRVDVYTGSETEPEKIAEDILRRITYSFVRTVDGTPCNVTQYAPEPGEIRCRYEFHLPDHADQSGFAYLEDEPDRLDEAIRNFVLGSGIFKKYDFDLYVGESSRYPPREAFHSFHHALRLAAAPDYPLLIPPGLDLGLRLLAGFSWDYADWVGAAVSSLADACKLPAERVKALQIQGVARSRLGGINAAVECFETVGPLLAQVDDPFLRAQVRMSFGLSVMDLHAHWETLDIEERRACEARMTRRMKIADRELQAARSLLAEIDDERARRDIRFIDLERLRVRDLLGDHAGALSAFDDILPNAPPRDKQPLTEIDIDKVKYEGTRLHYRLAAAIKLAESGDADLTEFMIEEIPGTVAKVNQLPTQRPIADRLAYLMVLTSRFYLQLALDWHSAEALAGQAPESRSLSTEPIRPLSDKDRDLIAARLGEVRKNLASAWEIQRSLETGIVRPPQSGLEYAGLQVIDVSGLFQQTQLLLAVMRNDPELVWEALSKADEVKGRFFQRDLAFSAARLPDRVSVHTAETLDELRHSLLSGIGDHRIVMAEFDRAIHTGMKEPDARQYIEETNFAGKLTREEIGNLLEADGMRSGLVYFYATARETLVYLITAADTTPEVARFQIDVGSIESASAALQGDLRSFSLAGNKHVSFLFKGLQRLFNAMLPKLLPLSRIVISAHGAWHGIPMHVILLPLLWDAGKEAGVLYVPSLKAWQLLFKRRQSMAAYERQSIALTTVPAREDLEEMFAEEHSSIRSILERTGRSIRSAFGQEATLQRGLEDLRNCGVHHFLAHGYHAGSDSAMFSGMLLASETGSLPTRSIPPAWNSSILSVPVLASDSARKSHSDMAGEMRAHMLTAGLMMANGTSASHVTLQACSIGRSSVAFRDELWGVTRALLAGGTNTVLAPLWDLDLRSSSELLGRFYEHWLLGEQPPWLALASAQREFATGSMEAFRHFSHWGALQLIGC